MPTLLADCPRCDAAKTTFDVEGKNYIGMEHNWVLHFEVFSVCRNCGKSTVFLIRLQEIKVKDQFNAADIWKTAVHLNNFFQVIRYISIQDRNAEGAPDHVPEDISNVYREAATCFGVECFNAAGGMFRLALDMSTKQLLPMDGEDGSPNRLQRTQLYHRLAYLFNAGILPRSLEELAASVREDGNDAAHDGNLAKADAGDLLDFTRLLLERVYTEPARLNLAKARRELRRADQ